MEQSQIAHFKIVSKLGEGGMGAVFRATDTKLNRDVAIKVLPDMFARDPERLARFTREAQALAALNHPNIATIHGIEESAIVMELVEGPTLADRIAQGAMPLEEVLGIAKQIAEALEAAHEKGIIHRDLKPANVKVTAEGTVKVLDFGLAKLSDASDPAESAAYAPTVVRGNSPTLAGMIMGTAGYMAPEQASGKPVDRRADIWAFGVVLYELLTGKVLFDGETVPHTLASVLKDPIDFQNVDAPAPIRQLLKRCLDRNPKTRLRDIGEARVAITQYLANPNPVVEGSVTPLPPQTRRSMLPWALAAVLIPVSATVGWMLRRTPPPPVLAAKFHLFPPEGTRFSIQGHAVSPDGRQLIVRAVERSAPRQRDAGRLYLRDLAGTTYRELAGTVGASSTVWSPDGKSILFWQSGKWRRMEIAGGAPLTLCDGGSQPRGATWNQQGTILIGLNGSIQRIPAGGGTPVPVTVPDAKGNETGHRVPNFLPGGRFFVYIASSGGGTGTAWVADLEGKEPRTRLMETDATEIKFAAEAGSETGLLLFRRGDGMMGVRFDARRRTIIGDPIPILETIPIIGNSSLAVSLSNPARVMAWSEETTLSDREELSLVDRAGKKISTLSPAGEMRFGHLEFSPDGKTLLGSRLSADGNRDLWAVDLVRGSVSRITFTGGGDKAQGWGPDGRQVFYMSMGADHGIYVTPADGTGKPELLVKTIGHHIGVSPDGRYVAFERSTSGRRSIATLEVSQRKVEDVITGTASFGWPQFSPDGRWLAYISDETGRGELYVQSFPPGRGKWQVSKNGARLGRWRRDGKELVFMEGTGLTRFFSVAVRQKGAALEFDTPAQLFELLMVGRAGSNYFALSPDGQRIALNLTPQTDVATPLTVALDWMEGLKK